MKLEAELTPVGSGGDRRRPGGGGGSGGCGGGGGLIPGEVVCSVVSLTQWTPPMMYVVLAWWQPVLILDVRVSICRQHLHTSSSMETSRLLSDLCIVNNLDVKSYSSVRQNNILQTHSLFMSYAVEKPALP